MLDRTTTLFSHVKPTDTDYQSGGLRDFFLQIVIMVKGWAKFMYEDKVTLVQAGDCVHQRPGIRHYLFDYSPDMEYLEIVSPADFKTVDVEPVCPIPDPTPWD